MSNLACLDVVIPARNEGEGLTRTLKALYLDAENLKLSVYLALNGEQVPDMLELVRKIEPEFTKRGHRIVVMECAKRGKSHALNTADQARDHSRPVLYLDADCLILPRTLSVLIAAMDGEEPVLVAPPMCVVPSEKFLSHAYFKVWERLPNMVDDVVGAGCFAVNGLGRKLWNDFPDEWPDDAYVRAQFPKKNRHVLSQGGFFFVPPEGPSLLSTINRWSAGNAKVGLTASGGSYSKNYSFKFIRETYTYLPTFALVKILAALSTTNLNFTDQWKPIRKSTPHPTPTEKPTVAVFVVTFQNESQIENCLMSVKSSWADLKITIVDNASRDKTKVAVRRFDGAVRLIENTKNRGFAAAVNQAVLQSDPADYILLLNPDVILAPTAIDEVLASALLRQDCRLYGGQMLDSNGRFDSSSCLAKPSLRSALSFFLGPAYLWYPPDKLGGWRRDDVRRVPILTGGFLLIDSSLWGGLKGLNEVYFLYGEDVDFSIRAKKFAASPLFTSRSVNTHFRGSSHASKTDMAIKTLAGKMTLTHEHLADWKKPFAKMFFRMGVRVRAIAQRRTATDRVNWRDVWDRRDEWQNGW